MTVDTSFDQELFDKEIKGKIYRKNKGTVQFVAESLDIDRSHEAAYNFVDMFVKIRNLKTQKTENIHWHEWQDRMVKI